MPVPLLQALVGHKEVVHVHGALVSPPSILTQHKVVGGRPSPVSCIELSLDDLCSRPSHTSNYFVVTVTLSKNLVSLVAALLPAAILLLSLQLR